MKKLKFMLAAATALGFAAVSQAEDFPGSTDFESISLTDSLFQFTGSEGDNESEIVTGSTVYSGNRPRKYANSGTSEKYLKVSTGTDPLLRKLNESAQDASQGIYIDTLVQFTVTPSTDEVTASAQDKLLIYLADTGAGATNLVVKTAVFSPGDIVLGTPDTLTPTTAVVAVNSVIPGDWYRLTVLSKVREGVLYFNLWLNGVELEAKDDFGNSMVLFDDQSENTALNFTSLLGKAPVGAEDANRYTSLAAVGFAGEGCVDDLAMTTQNPFPSAVDFTLSWPSGYTPVWYTIGGTQYALAGEDAPYSVTNAIEDAAIVFCFANADGVQKTLAATVAAQGTINAENATYAWSDYLGDTVAGAYEIGDGADLVMLQKGVLSGLATSGETFKQTANIDMTGVTDFYGIGWFDSSTSFASVPSGVKSDGKTALPFAGTYDGQGYTISNVTIVKHSYAGVFNNVSGTVKDLTVQDIGLSGTCTEWGCAIVGNASAGSLLENLTAVTSSGFNWGNSANHNVAGIVVRPIGAATIRGCVNNANISATAKRVGGIAAFVGSGSTGTVFDSCTNNADLVSTDGTRGVGGILGCAEGNTTETATYIRNCCDWGTETAQASGGHAGAIVGSNWNGSYTYTDDGGNTFKASTVDCGYVKNAVFGRAYATASTISGTDYLTTVKAADLAAGNTYTLLQDVAAGTVFTLQAAGDTIAFDTNGYTFGGTVDSVAALGVSSATAGTVTTYTAFTAVAKNGATKYATFKAAVEGASAGDTVEILGDCTESGMVTITAGITITNDYTVALSGMYALRFANGSTPVTICGAGTLAGSGEGSPLLIGSNETTKNAKYEITTTYEGSVTLDGNTITYSGSGNVIKLENGTFTMNSGTVTAGGNRGVKADADVGNFTSTVIINGGTITSTKAAVASSASADTGKTTSGTANVTINGGEITGPLTCGQNTSGTATLVIPGTSTAKFDRDQSAFCETGYKTTQSEGWYVVTADQQADWVNDSSTVSNQTAGAAYSALAGTALADADAQKLTDWAKAKNVAFNDATTSPAAYVDAFMLNCAPTAEAVAAAEEAFKLDITFDANGTPVVTVPTGYNVTPQLKGSNNLTTWTDVEAASTSYKFYKCELSL